MPHTRSRLSTEEMREIALEAARAILIDDGPQAVTLMAVAKRINRTHANILHHFGSAGELRRAMAEMMVKRVIVEIGEAVQRQRQTESDIREVVDMTFDAFARGAGAMASWMILTGNQNALDPILEAIHNLVEELSEDHAPGRMSIHEETLQLVLTALGDALLGGPMAKALGLPREKARELAVNALMASHKSENA